MRLATHLWLVLPALLLAGCSGTAQVSAPVAGQASAAASRPTAAFDIASPPPGAAPAAGQVRQAPGPFDDRFTLSDLQLVDGGVRGRLTVTSDVSDIIVLEVHSAFYDASGVLLGTAVQVQQQNHDSSGTAVPDENVDLHVQPAAAFRQRVAAARVWVPVLVNE